MHRFYQWILSIKQEVNNILKQFSNASNLNEQLRLTVSY